MTKVTIIRTEDDATLRAKGIHLEKLTAGLVQQQLCEMPVIEDWAKPMTWVLDQYKDKMDGASIVEDNGDIYSFLVTFKDNSGIIITIYRNRLGIKTQLTWEVSHGATH